ncbi:hypothetical protein RDI58_004564 [Solanum bulbocastanum]|uniref:Uncharacterized protein n=1 Tax=Solanum bulbocastanum TaxID=147425 RepID=A0AAN8TXU8_SOLBU
MHTGIRVSSLLLVLLSCIASVNSEFRH